MSMYGHQVDHGTNALPLSATPVWPDSSILGISLPPNTSDSRFPTPSIPSRDEEFSTLFEKPYLGPSLSGLVLRLVASRAIPPSAFTPLHTPKLMSTTPLTAVSIIATDVGIGWGFEVAKAYWSVSAAEGGGVGDEYASRRPDSAKVGLKVCDMGRTWRRGNPGIVDENTGRAGDGCEVDTRTNLFVA